MISTRPVFILGSGRSGTLALAKSFMESSDVEAHHEYLFENILSDAVLYAMGWMPEAVMLDRLRETHGAAVHYCSKPVWIDCSNALPWIVQPLHLLFPNARFVHVVRNGRRVVSSFYHKFDDIMYADDAVVTLCNWIEGRSAIKPPPEKRYWRPIPLPGEAQYAEFLRMNRFERLCYYWATVNARVGDTLRAIDPAESLTVKFEDLKNADAYSALCDFLGFVPSAEMFKILERPINVHVPRTFPLTPDEDAAFARLCGDVMQRFGYRTEEDYQVDYHPRV